MICGLRWIQYLVNTIYGEKRFLHFLVRTHCNSFGFVSIRLILRYSIQWWLRSRIFLSLMCLHNTKGSVYRTILSTNTYHIIHSPKRAYFRTQAPVYVKSFDFSCLVSIVLVWFGLLCSLLIPCLPPLSLSDFLTFPFIYMFESIEWHFMHVYLNVYLFIAAATADVAVIVGDFSFHPLLPIHPLFTTHCY